MREKSKQTTNSPLYVLLLEDYAPDAEIIVRQLKRDGIDVVWRRVDTQEAFVDALGDFDPDIVLSDYALPGFCGLDAVSLVRDCSRDTPVIIVTGSISEEIAVNCMAEGAVDYVLKENLSRLPSAVRRALEKRQFAEDKRRVERDLKLRNAAIESSSHPIFIADVNGHLTYANPAFISLWGYGDESEVRGRPFQPFFDAPSTIDEILTEIRHKGSWRGELWSKGEQDQKCLVSGTLSVVQSETEEPFAVMGCFSDITEQRRLETQLGQTQKMEALGTLAGGIAHDFNNFLTAIIGYTEMAIDDVSLDSELYDKLEQIYLAATRAAALVQQILTFSRSGENGRQPVHLHPVIKEILNLLQGSVPPNIEIIEEINPHCGRVNMDITEVHQTVMNLCVNALYAMRESGGELRVKIDNVCFDETHPTPSGALSSGTYVQLTVSDTGTGIKETVLNRIFEPFYTTKPSGEGTGLGLSTVHGIVKGLGGDILVQSAPGKGARFDVFVPVVSAERTCSVISDLPKFSVSAAEGSILIIDDESSITQVYKFALEQLGISVEAYVNAGEALRAYRADPDKYRLVLTDYIMPEKNGVELAKEIRSISKSVPILLCSGISDSIDLDSFKDIRIAEIIQKPIGSDSLRNAVMRHL